MKGVFISIEGPDGSGKSTIVQGLFKKLVATYGSDVLLTREPGGTGSEIAEKIREILLDNHHTMMDDRTEALLYAASRRQHLTDTILPALNEGKIVLTDRYVDSSLAYQGSGRNIGIDEVRGINEFAIQGLSPDFTIYLDIDAQTGLNRIMAKHSNRLADRLEKEDITFHEQVQAGYQSIIKKDRDRFFIIDANQSKAKVLDQAWKLVDQQLTEILESGS